ncbi:DNA/RNA nuclease SfsA [uncultured Ruminococcus sp.]|uniref:DNA/RNA nuclease SfsA n=1 Tax=uncultured Ruminococcus sp. TaxID=165186 RepID=UPI0025FB4EB5|nr:DNA/RNA nuclease SfsA [uncultured Ruminococcus sp.]
MRYTNIHKGTFISRPNRFIANVMIDGREEVCHVKNTGRCRELLVEGCTVWLEHSDSESRKTAFDLVTVEKGHRLINMDSQAPNKAVVEWLREKKPFGDGFCVYPERKYGNSRFDFYMESQNRKIFMEVKGCTLEKDGVVLFPDAPTLRGVKHIRELSRCLDEGYEAYIMILVQMSDVKYFTPNYDTHPEFGEALEKAAQKGVKILCYDCDVTPDSMTVGKPVEVKLGR